jgi:NAD(P)-dependent dehydrogenase (short-subunit alcohol dehydrogenase family)
MSKTIIVIGFGPGIATAVAERFGAEGFSVALVARNKERLAAGVAALKAKGIAAAAFEPTPATRGPSERRSQRRALRLARSPSFNGTPTAAQTWATSLPPSPVQCGAFSMWPWSASLPPSRRRCPT